MQQLKIEHKKTEKETTTLEYENKRERKGLELALSRNVFRLEQTDTFYVESETCKDLYYFVRYEAYFEWCSCMDNSTRHVKCKHLYAVTFAIMKGTLRDIDKLPPEAKRYPQVITESPKLYKEDQYDF